MTLSEPEIIPVSDNLADHADILSAAAELHRVLRPLLPVDYVSFMRKMFEGGAEMAVLAVNGEIKSLAVYRCYQTSFHGLRFYIDDLVTDEAQRGRGFGHRMLTWCEDRARARNCDTLALDSGVQRSRAHQFYFREGLKIFSFSFSKPLR